MAPSRCLKGGQTLKGHLKHKFLTETLADGGFDYVVIQDASYTPSYSTREVLENVYPYAQRIDSLAKAGLPETTALYLQKIAGETVRDNLSLIEIKI